MATVYSLSGKNPYSYKNPEYITTFFSIIVLTGILGPYILMLGLSSVNEDFMLSYNRYPEQFPKISIIQYDTDRVFYDAENDTIQVLQQRDAFGNVANNRGSLYDKVKRDRQASAVVRHGRRDTRSRRSENEFNMMYLNELERDTVNRDTSINSYSS